MSSSSSAAAAAAAASGPTPLADVVIRELRCEVCGDRGEIRYDHRRGTRVCTKCGTVAEKRVIDEGQEWRTFEKDDKGGGPNRAGGKDDELLGDLGFGTTVGSSEGDTAGYARFNQQNEPLLLRVLREGFREIGRLTGRMRLNQQVGQHARVLFKAVEQHEAKMGYAREIVLVTCIYAACKEAGVSMPLVDVATMNGLDPRSIRRAYQKMRRLKLTKKGSHLEGRSDAALYVRRFCDALRMRGDAPVPMAVVNAAEEIAANCSKKSELTGRKPATVAGAAIMLALSLWGRVGEERFGSRVETLTTSEMYNALSNATGMAPTTIRAAYGALYHVRHKVVPSSYATPAHLDDMDVGRRRATAATSRLGADTFAAAGGAAGGAVASSAAAAAAAAAAVTPAAARPPSVKPDPGGLQLPDSLPPLVPLAGAGAAVKPEPSVKEEAA